MPMELDLGPATRRFRDEVRGWLEANQGEVVIDGDATKRNIVGERVLGLPRDPQPPSGPGNAGRKDGDL
jgi:hypothetical protein